MRKEQFNYKKGVRAWVVSCDGFPCVSMVSNGRKLPDIALDELDRKKLEDFVEEIDDCEVIEVIIKKV